MKPEKFCAYPFDSIFLGPDGKIKPCCSSRYDVGSLHDKNIEEIIHSEELTSMRRAILNNEWHPNCWQCELQENSGAISQRDTDYDSFVNNLKGDISENSFLLKRLDLRWSNVCNLNCVYCYEFFSSKWSKINNIPVNALEEENIEDLLNYIKDNKENISMIMLLGGEPLLQKPNEELLNIVSTYGIYTLSNFSVPLKTNLIAQKLIKEPNAGWGISFETVGDKFEYVRRGASWKTLKENIDYYNTLNLKQNLDAHSLYSIYSAFNLVEFYDFITENNFKGVYWNLLHSSGENENTSVLKLPYHMKVEMIKEIEKCYEKYPTGPGVDRLLTFKKTMEDTIDVIATGNVQQGLIDEINSTENKLKYEKTFSDIWPNVWELLNGN